MSIIRELVKLAATGMAGYAARAGLLESVPLGRASMLVTHRRPTDFKKNPLTGLWEAVERSFILIDEPELVWNQITNAGRDQLHLQGYGSTGLATNGFNYIALTNTAITPAAGDTTLSGEISANGLARAQGTYAHTASTNTSTIDKTFTCTTAPQAAQAAALFNAASVGTMNHELTFTQRSLQVNDTLQITYTITLG